MNENIFFYVFFSGQKKMFTSMIDYHQQTAIYRSLIINFYLKKTQVVTSSGSCIVFRPSTYLEEQKKRNT